MLPLEVCARDRNIGTSELILIASPPSTHGANCRASRSAGCRTPNPITVRFTTKIEPGNTASPMM